MCLLMFYVRLKSALKKSICAKGVSFAFESILIHDQKITNERIFHFQWYTLFSVLEKKNIPKFEKYSEISSGLAPVVFSFGSLDEEPTNWSWFSFHFNRFAAILCNSSIPMYYNGNSAHFVELLICGNAISIDHITELKTHSLTDRQTSSKRRDGKNNDIFIFERNYVSS